MSIKNPQAEKLAHELAALTGESLTAVIIEALETQLEKVKGRKQPRDLTFDIMEIAERCAGYPTLDPRPPDEILAEHFEDGGGH